MNITQLTALCKKTAIQSLKAQDLILKAREETAKYLGYADYNDFIEKVDEDWSDSFIDSIEYGQSGFTREVMDDIISELKLKIERSKS